VTLYIPGHIDKGNYSLGKLKTKRQALSRLPATAELPPRRARERKGEEGWKETEEEEGERIFAPAPQGKSIQHKGVGD